MANRKIEIPEAPTLVLIRWLDASAASSKERATPVPCLTAGWIVEVGEREGMHYVKVASELHQDDGESGSTEHVSIPSGMIQQIIPIRRKMPGVFRDWSPA